MIFYSYPYLFLICLHIFLTFSQEDPEEITQYDLNLSASAYTPARYHKNPRLYNFFLKKWSQLLFNFSPSQQLFTDSRKPRMRAGTDGKQKGQQFSPVQLSTLLVEFGIKRQQLADNNYILTSKEEYFPLGQLLPKRNPRSLTPA